MRRFLEAEHRPDIYQMTQDGMVRVATRGDHVMLGHDVLEDSQWAGQVRAVSGGVIELDERVRQEAGKRYGIRFRSFNGQNNRIGRSVLREVEGFAGESDVLIPAGSGAMPQAGDLVLFGELGRESRELVVTHIEATQDHCQIIRAVDAAPQIDELLTAMPVPEWSSRVGDEIGTQGLLPSAPRFVSVTTGAGAQGPMMLMFRVEPGAGGAALAQYRIGHRRDLAGGWSEMVIAAAAGGGGIAGYAHGQLVELRCQGIGDDGLWSLVLAGQPDGGPGRKPDPASDRSRGGNGDQPFGRCLDPACHRSRSGE